MTVRPCPPRHPRTRRVFRPDGKTLVVAMDHASFMDVGRFLRDPGQVIEAVVAGGADALIATFGITSRYGGSFGRAGLLLRVDGGPTSLFEGEGRWPLLFSAEDALRLGADGVVCMGFPGAAGEIETMGNLAQLASDCRKWGLLLLAEMIPGGFARPDLHTPENIAMAARLGAEAGADVIKTVFTGSGESFRHVTEGCYCPVLTRGGERTGSETALLSSVAEAIGSGGAGVAIGRNVWQSADPRRLTAALARVIHGGASVEEAFRISGRKVPGVG